MLHGVLQTIFRYDNMALLGSFPSTVAGGQYVVEPVRCLSIKQCDCLIVRGLCSLQMMS